MRLFWLYVIAGFVIWPIHSTAAMVGDKPIEMMLSDLLFVLLPIVHFFIRTSPSRAAIKSVKGEINWYGLMPHLTVICIVYMTALAGIGLGLSAETIRLFSAFKLVKPMAFVFLGLFLGSSTDPFEFIDIIGRAYGVVVGITLFCTVSDPGFPMDYWGKYIFGFELNGYPNTAMSFYAALVPLLFASIDSTKLRILRPIGWFLIVSSTLMILGSMSRSSLIALVFGTVIYLVMTEQKTLLSASAIAITVLSLVGFGAFSALKDTDAFNVLTQRINDRVDRSTEQDDPSSGRFEIWQFAIELCAEKPVFGFMFEPFSRYTGDVDTPHQQYLEIAYKAGGLGLVIYMMLIASCLMATRRLLRLTEKRTPAWYRLHAMSSMLIGILIGNLTQPNLTYSLTGNMVFLLFGSLCTSRAVISASERSETPFAVFSRSTPVRRPRIAA